METFEQYKLWITNELTRHSSEISKIGEAVNELKSDIKVLQTKMLLATSMAATLVSILVSFIGKGIG